MGGTRITYSRRAVCAPIVFLRWPSIQHTLPLAMKIFPALVPITLSACIAVFACGCGRSKPNAPGKPANAAADTADSDGTPSQGTNLPAGGVAVPADPADAAPPTAAPQTADRVLPSPPVRGATDMGNEPAVIAEEPADLPEWKPDGPSAEEVASKAFHPPPNAKSLSKTGRLWIDKKRERVYIDGYVAMTRGPLEMFACPVGTKEHESIVAVLAKSRDVHAALLAIDATPGTPVRFRPEFLPPTGQVIRVWVCWYDSSDQFHAVDGREWIEDLQTENAMTAQWVFAGSGFWQDPEDKREYYQADSGDMICVSNFSSAMLDIAMSSSADADSLRFVPFEKKIPARETPVRLVLVPVPFPADNPQPGHDANLQDKPTAKDLPRAK